MQLEKMPFILQILFKDVGLVQKKTQNKQTMPPLKKKKLLSKHTIQHLHFSVQLLKLHT